jgi:hypothetical protein
MLKILAISRRRSCNEFHTFLSEVKHLPEVKAIADFTFVGRKSTPIYFVYFIARSGRSLQAKRTARLFFPKCLGL